MLDSIKPYNKEDFDPQSLVAPIDAHTKDISDLSARLKVLEDKFGSHTQEAVKISDMFESNFLNLIN